MNAQSLPVKKVSAINRRVQAVRRAMNIPLTVLSREEIQEIANKVARKLKLKSAPKLSRINRRRGWAHFSQGFFSVPAWAMSKSPAYALYYIAHELTHFALSESGHGPRFHRVESEVMESFGYRLVYAERGPYAREIRRLVDSVPVCDQYGSAICPANLFPVEETLLIS